MCIISSILEETAHAVSIRSRLRRLCLRRPLRGLCAAAGCALGAFGAGAAPRRLSRRRRTLRGARLRQLPEVKTAGAVRAHCSSPAALACEAFGGAQASPRPRKKSGVASGFVSRSRRCLAARHGSAPLRVGAVRGLASPVGQIAAAPASFVPLVFGWVRAHPARRWESLRSW